MADPCKTRAFTKQKLSAPDRSVGAQPGAIKTHRQHFFFQMMLRHHRQSVGVMVLHLIKRQSVLFRKLFAPLGGRISRMQIRHHCLRFYIEKMNPVMHRVSKKLLCLFQRYIPRNFSGKELSPCCQAKARFHLAA